MLCLPTWARATAQVPDRIIFDGETHPLFSNPLDDYWKRPQDKPELFSEGAMSTGNWRGYVATFELRDDTLWLNKIEKEYDNDQADKDDHRNSWVMRVIPAYKVFPMEDYPIKATWYSGVLRIPQGEQLRYVHMGYQSTYERELIFVIEHGQVVESHVIDNAGKNLYRSQSDLEFCAIGNAELDASGDWIDGRLIDIREAHDLFETGKPFRMRGIFFTNDDGAPPAYLWIPDTPKTQSVQLPINELPDNYQAAEGSHVEVAGRFQPAPDGGHHFVASSIQPLKPGQTIHDPEYPDILAKLAHTKDVAPE